MEGLSDVDRRFLLAMAQDDGESRLADVAGRLGVDVNYAGVYRQRLIRAGMIASTGRGPHRSRAPRRTRMDPRAGSRALTGTGTPAPRPPAQRANGSVPPAAHGSSPKAAAVADLTVEDGSGEAPATRNVENFESMGLELVDPWPAR